jgi:predicted transcriptional regulator
MQNDEPNSEDMMYRAYVLDAIRCGSEEIDRGEAIEHEDLKRRLAEWLEK